MNTDFIVDKFRNAYQNKGYAFFEKGDYNLNTFGIRCKNKQSDLWDDIRGHVFKDCGVWQVQTWVQTTDPGKPGLINPCRPEGCAILVPGQYRGCYEGGHHKGDRNRWSLIQAKPVSVYRDWNKDDQLDFDPKTIMTGNYGINIHGPWRDDLEKVGDAGLGCQVAESILGHKQFMKTYTLSVEPWGKALTYTIFTEADFNG